MFALFFFFFFAKGKHLSKQVSNLYFCFVNQPEQGLTLQVQDQGVWGAFTDQRHPGHLDIGNTGI